MTHVDINGPLPPPTGFIEIGLSPDGKSVVLNHPKIEQTENGGHIVFTPQQAWDLARTLIRAALQAAE